MAHTMIPHNHQETDLCLLNGHSHTGLLLSDEYHSHGDDYDVCRISSLLFHQLSQDNLIIDFNRNDLLFPALQKELISENYKHSLYCNTHHASVSLRAPPAA